MFQDMMGLIKDELYVYIVPGSSPMSKHSSTHRKLLEHVRTSTVGMSIVHRDLKIVVL